MGGASYVPASALGFQNPLMWAQMAMMQGAAGGGGRGFETSRERAARQGKVFGTSASNLGMLPAADWNPEFMV